MEKHIYLFKKTFVFTGSLSIILALIDYFFNLMYFDTKGYFGAFQFLMFSIFTLSLYLFFISSDIKKDKFIYLSWLNYILLIASLLSFSYWGIIYQDALALLFPAYFAIMTIINLIVMSIVYLIKKTGRQYFFKDWIFFVGLIVFYIVYGIINREINS
ncbi:hypothetical protein [Flavobacterium sp. DSR2-3-3]|uniref:hypothetical protein n=1 Tax=Flavobacterium sp. DSR2-3-3 TaxID=2804632 RepID=UPI003CFA2ADF